jgi:hypothetical protein
VERHDDDTSFNPAAWIGIWILNKDQASRQTDSVLSVLSASARVNPDKVAIEHFPLDDLRTESGYLSSSCIIVIVDSLLKGP